MYFLETARLVLRKLQEEDFDDFCDYAMDEEMCIMMGRNMMHTKEDARINFDWLINNEKRCYALLHKSSRKVIGNLTVTKVPKEVIKQDILSDKSGYSMSFCISRTFQRQGLMTEAVTSTIDYLFKNETIDYLHCGYLSFNKASEDLQSKLGFNLLLTQNFEDDGVKITAIENVLWKDDFIMLD